MGIATFAKMRKGYYGAVTARLQGSEESSLFFSFDRLNADSTFASFLRYCSKECQKLHWRLHKNLCNPDALRGPEVQQQLEIQSNVKKDFSRILDELGVKSYEDVLRLDEVSYIRLQTAAHLCLKCDVNPGTCLLCYAPQRGHQYSQMGNSHIMSKNLWEIFSGEKVPIHLPGKKDATTGSATKFMLCTSRCKPGNSFTACEQTFSTYEAAFKDNFLVPLLNCNDSITIAYGDWLFLNIVSLVWRGMMAENYISATNNLSIDTNGRVSGETYSRRQFHLSESDVCKFPWDLERSFRTFLRCPTEENALKIRVYLACSDCKKLDTTLYINETSYASSPDVSLCTLPSSNDQILIFSVVSVKFLVCSNTVTLNEEDLIGTYPISSHGTSELKIPRLEERRLSRLFVANSIGCAERRSIGAGQRGYPERILDPSFVCRDRPASRLLYQAALYDEQLLKEVFDGTREPMSPLIFNYIEQSGLLRWRTTSCYQDSKVAKGIIYPVDLKVSHLFTKSFQSDDVEFSLSSSNFVHGYKKVDHNGRTMSLILCIESAVHVHLKRLVLSGWIANYMDPSVERLVMTPFKGCVPWSKGVEDEETRLYFETKLREAIEI